MRRILPALLLFGCSDPSYLVSEPVCDEEHQEAVQKWVLSCIEKSQGNAKDCRHAGEELICPKKPHVRFDPCHMCPHETVPCEDVRGTEMDEVCPNLPTNPP